MLKRFKKLGFLFLVFSLMGMLLVACSGDEDKSSGEGGTSGETETPDVEDPLAMEDYDVGVTFRAAEPLTISLMFQENPDYPFKEDWALFEEIEKRTNVSFDLTVVPLSDYSQKRSLLISSGDAPLIIPKTYPGEELPFVASGAILPISDYIEWMPNFMDKVEKWDLWGDLETLKQLDGKFYVLPGIHEGVVPEYTIALRTDLLEEYGLEEPTTWDEFRDVLRVFKENNPDSIPFSDRWQGESLLNFAAASFGTRAGWGLGNGAQYDRENDEFVFGPATEEYKTMLEYFHSLVAEGLMDRESFTQDDDQAIQKLVTEQSFAISTNIQTLLIYRNSMNETLGEGNFEIKKILVPGGPKGHVIAGSRLENGIMFNAELKDHPNFKAIIQFVDWLWYSDEGQELSKWGVEGVHFEKDENGERRLLDPWDFLGLNPTGTKDLRIENGFSSGVFSYGGPTELVTSMMPEEEKEWQQRMAETKELLPVDPPYPMDEAEREQLTLISTPLTDFVKTATLEFILGERDFADWDAYVAELEAKGMGQFLELVNNAYERYKESN